MGNPVLFKKYANRATFDALTTKDANTIYFILDTQEIFLGDKNYTLKSGGKMTGDLDMDGNTITGVNEIKADYAVSGGSVDLNDVATFSVVKSGQSETHFLSMEGNQIKYLMDGTDYMDAVNLGQLDTAIQNNVSDKLGAANGIATLDNTGKVPSSQLPSYVDDVLEYPYSTQFPTTGEAGKIYVALDSNKTYRWSGTAYVEISASLALGETASTAYRGDRGKIAYDHSQKKSGNPHYVSKSDVGLGYVQNYDIASQIIAEAGVSNIAYMTPLRTKQAILALSPKLEWEEIDD